MAREKKAGKRKHTVGEVENLPSRSTKTLTEKIKDTAEAEDLLAAITNDDDSTDAESEAGSEVESDDAESEDDNESENDEGSDNDIESENGDVSENDDGSENGIDSNDVSENGDVSENNVESDSSGGSSDEGQEQNGKEDSSTEDELTNNVNHPPLSRSSGSSPKSKGKQIKEGIKSLALGDSTKKRNPTLRPEKNKSKSTPTKQLVDDDEYKSDTSDEEDIRNTVGNIPMNWYDEYSHLGYDWDGKKIIKPKKTDELDNFLKRMEDPNFWRTVKDPQTGQDVILCDADVDMIERLQSQKIPDAEYDEYAPWIEWFTSEVMQTPVRKFPEHKRSFLPSLAEKRKVGKIVHALKMGWIKPRREMKKKKKDNQPEFYMLWQTDDNAEEMRRISSHIPAPKRLLPGHAESYNPPPEYLFDAKEIEEWNKYEETPSKRKLHFIPQKYQSLREVPAYPRYIKERFLRCLDLYLCPRARKLRLTIEPEDLVPQLPSPKDLQPFPTVQSIIYKGHTDMIRSITVEPRGQYLISGSDDMTVKVWEICTGRCVRTIPVGGVVRSVSWCPNQALSLVAVAADKKVLLINPGVGDHLISTKTDSLLEEAPEQDVLSSERVKTAVSWEQATGENWEKGIRVIINHFKEVKQVAWHGRGDYFATVMPDGQNRSVLIHQLSKRRSQVPFNKSKGLIQCVMFHPVRPFFFVATQRNVRVYDLAKQEMVKKLLSNSKWISSMAIHPGGDNILVGTYDRKMLWFDLDLSTQPYQSLRLHGSAVRGVAYHKRYPLFASGSDDRNLIISHGMVYNDLLQNPLIVPLKRLSNHDTRNDFGIFDVVFHPTQPWVFSSGGDATVRLYT